MSLNQLLAQGFKGDGLDIKCSSIQCLDTIAGSLINGTLTVEEKVFLNDDLKVIGETDTQFLKVGNRSVILNGVLENANLIGIQNVLNTIQSSDFTYQKFGDNLSIQGEFSFTSDSLVSEVMAVDFTIPAQFVMTSDDNMNLLLLGNSSPNIATTQSVIGSELKPQNTTRVRMYFRMADGLPCAVALTAYRVSFSCLLTDVFFAS